MPRANRAPRLLSPMILAVLLTACGVSDDGASTTSAAPASVAPTASAAPATSAAPGTTAPSPITGAVSTTSTAASSAPAAAPLRILVTNDDGVEALGIDMIVQALLALPDVEVTAVAPLANQSGSGSSTSPGPLAATDATTASGYPAKAVDGFPADSVVWALANLADKPDVVVSGINQGQNVGPLASISGTVGAALTAADAGIPAVALSQGFLPAGVPDYATGARLAIEWLSANRDDLAAAMGDEPGGVVNINIPTCAAGTVRGLYETIPAVAWHERSASETDCASTSIELSDDVDAFNHGYAPVAIVTRATIEQIQANG